VGKGRQTSGALDPLGSSDAGAHRVIQGGSWLNLAQSVWAAYRYQFDPGHGEVVVRRGQLHNSAFATPICKFGKDVHPPPLRRYR